MKARKEEYKIKTFQDIIKALLDHPEWLEELRKIILTEELMNLPQKFEKFVREEFKPLKEKVEKIEKDMDVLKQDVAVLKQDVAVLKQDVAVLKQDVAVLKQDTAELKGDNFERKVRERAPSYFGRLILKCRVVGMEDLVDKLEEAMDKGLISEEEKEDALNADVVVTGELKRTKEKVVLVSEVSVKADVKDVERAKKRAEIIGRVFNLNSLAVVIGKEHTKGADDLSSQLGVIVV